MLRKNRSVALRLMLTRTPVYHRLASCKARSLDLPQESGNFQQEWQSSKHPAILPGVARNLPFQQGEQQTNGVMIQRTICDKRLPAGWSGRHCLLKTTLPGSSGTGTEPTQRTLATRMVYGCRGMKQRIKLESLRVKEYCCRRTEYLLPLKSEKKNQAVRKKSVPIIWQCRRWGRCLLILTDVFTLQPVGCQR